MSKAESVFLTDFTGVNVKDVSALRSDFRQANVEYMVAKNTLIRRAVAESPWAGLDSYLEGPTAMVISQDQGVTAAKIISKFRETHESFKPKVGMMNEKVFNAEMIEVLAKLPTRDELISKLMGSLNAPITNLVYVLNDTIARAVRIMAKVAETKAE